jgi:hypothetical protein
VAASPAVIAPAEGDWVWYSAAVGALVALLALARLTRASFAGWFGWANVVLGALLFAVSLWLAESPAVKVNAGVMGLFIVAFATLDAIASRAACRAQATAPTSPRG